MIYLAFIYLTACVILSDNIKMYNYNYFYIRLFLADDYWMKQSHGFHIRIMKWHNSHLIICIHHPRNRKEFLLGASWYWWLVALCVVVVGGRGGMKSSIIVCLYYFTFSSLFSLLLYCVYYSWTFMLIIYQFSFIVL